MGKSNIEAIYRLAPVQEGILYHTLQEPGRRKEDFLRAELNALDLARNFTELAGREHAADNFAQNNPSGLE